MAAHDVIDDKSDGQAGETQDGGYYKIIRHGLTLLVIEEGVACYLTSGDKGNPLAISEQFFAEYPSGLV
jgi:hypothetical protein